MAVLLIGMLDEREPALQLARSEMVAHGLPVILIDIGIGNGAIVPGLQPDIGPHDIAAAGETGLDEIRQLWGTARERVTTMMAEGLAKVVLAMHDAGRVDGVLTVTGMTGAMICLPALKRLPFGLPKLMITTAAAMPAYAGKMAGFFGMRDITVMHAVVDTVGLNSMVRRLIINGTGAICGMVEARAPDVSTPSAIAITEFGFCDTAAQLIRDRLESTFDMVSFHAIGIGERAALDFIRQGGFEAFIDLVPAGFSEYLLGGNRALGPDRFDAGMEMGKPYIIAPCGFDMIGCGPIERRDRGDPLWTKRNLARRPLLVQDAMRVQARTTIEELQIIARQTATCLNRSKTPHLLRFIVPMRGFSSISVRGAALYQPDAERAFVETLKANLNTAIEVIEVDADINSPRFADTVTKALYVMRDAHRG